MKWLVFLIDTPTECNPEPESFSKTSQPLPLEIWGKIQALVSLIASMNVMCFCNIL